ncbi:hypothetical protein CRUP_033140, partial [Coryphaenoides rupestris]
MRVLVGGPACEGPCMSIPGLSTPVWMTSSTVKPLGVSLSRRLAYISGVRILAMWLLCLLRSGNSWTGSSLLRVLSSLGFRGNRSPTVTAERRGSRFGPVARRGGTGSSLLRVLSSLGFRGNRSPTVTAERRGSRFGPVARRG